MVILLIAPGLPAKAAYFFHKRPVFGHIADETGLLQSQTTTK
jgi:hypothetical protein